MGAAVRGQPGGDPVNLRVGALSWVLAPRDIPLEQRFDWVIQDAPGRGLDLVGGECVPLICGSRFLVRSRWSRFNELKMMFVVALGLAASRIPAVMRFIERHFAVEFLVMLFIGMLYWLFDLSRLFSRRPGAMVYLMEDPAPSESH